MPVLPAHRLEFALQKLLLATRKRLAALLHFMLWEFLARDHCVKLVEPVGQRLGREPPYSLHSGKSESQSAENDR